MFSVLINGICDRFGGYVHNNAVLVHEVHNCNCSTCFLFHAGDIVE